MFLLDYSVDVCVLGATTRVGHKREDMPWFEDSLNEEFKQKIIEFSKNKLPEIYDLLNQYVETKNIVIFKTREEAENYLNDILAVDEIFK